MSSVFVNRNLHSINIADNEPWVFAALCVGPVRVNPVGMPSSPQAGWRHVQVPRPRHARRQGAGEDEGTAEFVRAPDSCRKDSHSKESLGREIRGLPFVLGKDTP